MSFGSNPPIRTSFAFPSTEDWEELIRVYLFNLFWINARSRRRYLQRSILITTKAAADLEEELNFLLQDLHDRLEDRELQYELIEQEYLHVEGREPVAYDSSVVTISRPLTVARRSTRTGIVYADPDMQFCPHTGTTMQYFITARTHVPGS